MKLFDIYDNWGNPIGEIHYRDPDIGLGSFASVFGLFLAIIAPIVIWIAWYKVSFSPWSSEMDRITGVCSMVLLLVTILVHSIVLKNKKRFSFTEVWGQLVLSATMIDGSILCAFVCMMEGSGFSISYLFMSMFIVFLMSVGMGFGAAATIALVRRFSMKIET